MAKNKEKVDLTKKNEVTKVGKKPKLFKLGEDASLFVDPETRKKVLPGQKVSFDAREMSTDKFKAAKKHAHLVEADGDEEETQAEEVNQDLVDFTNAGDSEARVKYIEDNYDVTPEEVESLKALSEDELMAEFKKTYLED